MSEDRISLEEYTALREGAGTGQISARAPIAVTGSDRAAFLQGLLTNDIQALTPGTGCYAAWLTPQGRMLTDLHVLESGDMILLDVPASRVAAILERLDQFLFTEDVRLAPLADELRGVWLHGPLAAAVLERTVRTASGLEEWPEYRHGRFDWEGTPVVIARISQVGAPGYCTYLPGASAEAFRARLRDAGALAVNGPAIDAARIEAGYPVFGIDMTEDTIPLEAGIEQRAISFTKGCYVGQEVVIRVLHRGGGRVARKLVALKIAGGVPPAASRLQAGDRDVGFITSAAESPRWGAIALAYVHRDFTAPGTPVLVVTPSGTAAATVSERPIA